MLDVLVYMYENYWDASSCPERSHLGRKLSAMGFEPDEITQALNWLEGLRVVSSTCHSPVPLDAPELSWTQASTSMRVFSSAEQETLGALGMGFVSFLESCGVLSAHLREVVIDRAMAAADHIVSLDDLKIIVLMAYWGAGVEPEALILDELCEDSLLRIAH